MALFASNSKTTTSPFSEYISKGRLITVDTESDEFIEFQFNPTNFEWTRKTNWGATRWVGSSKGGDLSYLSTGPRKISLDLVYLADYSTYTPNYESSDKIIDDNGLVDFQAIRSTIERWETPLENTGTPTRIMIKMGPNSFTGVIESSTFIIKEFFASGLEPKRGILSLEFREWNTILSSP